MNFRTLLFCSIILSPFVGLFGLTIVKTASQKAMMMIGLLGGGLGSAMFHVVGKIFITSSENRQIWVGPGSKVVILFFDQTWIVVAYLLVLGFAGFHLNRLAEKRLRRLGQSPQERKHKLWINALYYDGEKSD